MEGLSKEQVRFCIQGLIIFLNGSLKRKNLKAFFIEKQKDICLSLLTKLDDAEVDLQEIAESFNVVIERINAYIPENQPAYPSFDFRYPSYVVKSEILGFEHYLIHKLDEGRLTKDQQFPLWQRATTIWGKVGIDVSPEDGLQQFSDLVDSTNLLLLEHERYPNPS